MLKQKNKFYFFAYLRLKIFCLPDRFAPALGQSGHNNTSLSEILLMLSYGKVSFKSCSVYCSCFVLLEHLTTPVTN